MQGMGGEFMNISGKRDSSCCVSTRPQAFRTEMLEPLAEYTGTDGLQRWQANRIGYAVRDREGRVHAVRNERWQADIIAASLSTLAANGDLRGAA